MVGDDGAVLLDARAARQCPVVLQRSLGGPLPTSTSEVVSKWRDAAQVHRAAVLDTCRALLGPQVVVIEPAPYAEALAATDAARSSGAAVVAQAVLPDDPVGHRRGRVDLLVAHRDGWVPVLIKRHRVAERRTSSQALASMLAAPFPTAAAPRPGAGFGRMAQGDGVELAHLWRLLEAAQWTPSSGPAWAGVVDSEQVLWWQDLAAARPGQPRSLLERYDEEFSLRRSALGAALAHAADPSVPLALVPLRKQECERCPYGSACLEEMVQADSVSLVAGVQWRHALRHLRAGVRTRRELAALDPETAAVVREASQAGGTTDLSALQAAAGAHDPEQPIGQVLRDDHGTRRALRRRGVEVVGDLQRLDPATLAYREAAMAGLADSIDRARAGLAGQAFLRRGVTEVDLARAALEVDLDLERSEAGTYLWGALVTTRQATAGSAPVELGYRAFVEFDPLEESGELRLLRALLDWFAELSAACELAGWSWRVYWYSHAEADELRRLARLSGDPDVGRAVEELCDPRRTSDLREVVERHLVVGHGVGLKKMSVYSGFRWRDADPSGSESMAWYDRAVGDPDPAVREANRLRLLAYNEDDCRATLALREWLTGSNLTGIEHWTWPAS